jgi:hypothetical protein
MDAEGRYRLTYSIDGARVTTGWWDLLATAEKKWKGWRDDHGRDGARITLVDTEDGRVIRSWP